MDPRTGIAAAMTTTNERGEFEISADAGSVLRARAIGYVGEYAGQTRDWQGSSVLAPSQDIRFALSPCGVAGFGAVSGRIADADTRQGLADAWVYGTAPDGQTYFATTGGDGGFELDGLADGTLTLDASGVGYLPERNAVTTQGGNATASMLMRRTDATLDAKPAPLPAKVALAQNYPNPFAPGAATRISYALPTAAHVRVTVYTLLGDRVASLVDASKPAGFYTASWNAAGMPSGMYIYKLEAGGVTITRRMTLLR
jgi:hypothetical protein